MRHNVIGSTSAGNAVVYLDEILVDVGLSYAKMRPHMKNVKYILLTHEHGDHLKLITISQILSERPDIIWIVPFYLVEKISSIPLKNVFVVEFDKTYKIGKYIIETVTLFHDVPNVGYKILAPDYKIIHATDTGKIDHIEALGYDLYAIEWNHDILNLALIIEQKINDGVFSHEVRVMNTHLSIQKAEAWINSQKADHSEILKLHMGSQYREYLEGEIQ